MPCLKRLQADGHRQHLMPQQQSAGADLFRLTSPVLSGLAPNLATQGYAEFPAPLSWAIANIHSFTQSIARSGSASFLSNCSSNFRRAGRRAAPASPARCGWTTKAGHMAMPARSKRDKETQAEKQVEIWEPSRKPRIRAAAEWLRTEEDAFDQWLRQSLHEAFDTAVAEPVPEEILRLIEEDRVERERLRSSREAKRGKYALIRTIGLYCA